MASRGDHKTPNPLDIKVGGWPMALVRGEQGAPMWRETRVRRFEQQQLVDAKDARYALLPLDVEVPYVIDDLSGGAGAADQHPERRDVYHYGRFTDCSSGQAVKGPLFITDTNASGNTPALSGGTPGYVIDFDGVPWASIGAKVMRWFGGWTNVVTLTGEIGQTAVFQGTQTSPYLYIPQNGGSFYTIPAGSATATVNAAGNLAEHFWVEGNALWRSWTDASTGARKIAKAEDGGNNPTWGGATTIGDPRYPITGLVSAADRLFVTKEDGLFAPSLDVDDTQRVDQDLTPELRHLRRQGNGKRPIVWDDTVIFVYGGGLWRYDPYSAQLTQFGPETLEGNRSPVTGEVQCAIGYGNICLFAIVWNEQSNTSYLCRFGGWRTADDQSGAPVGRRFVPAWHYALYEWANTRIVALHITTFVSVPPLTNPLLYAFASDGNIYYSRLARTSDVASDPNYLYDVSNTGRVFYPRFTGNVPSEEKLATGVGVYGRDLNGNRTLSAEAKAAHVGVYTAVGTSAMQDPGERLVPTTLPQARGIDVAATLTTSDSTKSPLLNALVIYSNVGWSNIHEIEATVSATENAADRVGRPGRRSAEDSLATIAQLVSAAEPFTIVDHRGRTRTVKGLDDATVSAEDNSETQGRRHIASFRVVETRPAAALRGTHERLATYTHDQLASFTHDQLRVL